MGWDKLKLVLIAVLIAANGILAVAVLSLYRQTSTIPAESIREVSGMLAEENILVNVDAIPTRRMDRPIYSGTLGDGYAAAVAAALCESAAARTFSAPDGVVLSMENGDRCVFSDRFGFRYEAAGIVSVPEAGSGLRAVGASAAKRARRAVADFLDRAIPVASAAQPAVGYDVTVLGADEESGVILCSLTQSLRGAPLARLGATAAVADGRLVHMEGAWCFAEIDGSTSSQLLDQINILYGVKTRISAGEFPIWIESLGACYAAYFQPKEDRFYLIPAWDMVYGDGTHTFINAVDGSLYTY